MKVETFPNINFIRYQNLNCILNSEFKRLVGIRRQVFTEMLDVSKKLNHSEQIYTLILIKHSLII